MDSGAEATAYRWCDEPWVVVSVLPWLVIGRRRAPHPCRGVHHRLQSKGGRFCCRWSVCSHTSAPPNTRAFVAPFPVAWSRGYRETQLSLCCHLSGGQE